MSSIHGDSSTQQHPRSKYDRFGRIFATVQVIVSIGLIALALVFEFRKSGDISQSKQATFAHLFLAYACYMFLTAVLLFVVVTTYKLFTLYIIVNSILAVVNLVIAVLIYIYSNAILTHGSAKQIYDMISIGLAIIFVLFALLLGMMSIITGVKLHRVNKIEQYHEEQQRIHLQLLSSPVSSGVPPYSQMKSPHGKERQGMGGTGDGIDPAGGIGGVGVSSSSTKDDYDGVSTSTMHQKYNMHKHTGIGNGTGTTGGGGGGSSSSSGIVYNNHDDHDNVQLDVYSNPSLSSSLRYHHELPPPHHGGDTPGNMTSGGYNNNNNNRQNVHKMDAFKPAYT